MELTKKDSKMLQGLCALAMVCLHLFNKNHEDLFQPLVFIKGIPLSFYISLLCDFCVMGYAFCSGYAHMKIYEKQDGYYRKRLKGLLPLLCNYWVILLVFSAVSAIAGKAEFMPGNIKNFIFSALLLDNSYNGAWWYMLVYIIIVIISPAVLKMIKKNMWIILGVGFCVYCVAYYVRFSVQTDNWFLIKFGPFGMTLFEYIAGAVCYKIQFFSKAYDVWIKISKHIRTGVSILLIVGMLIGRTLIVPSLFIAPVTGFVIICLFHFWKKPDFVQKIFVYIGEHSTNI